MKALRFTFVSLVCVAFAACSLNPQPIPPGATASADGGTNAVASPPQQHDPSLDGGRSDNADSSVGEVGIDAGGNADAAPLPVTDAGTDAPTDADPDADPDAEVDASDATVD